jgi:tRNA-dihydrouridine synthase 1
MRKLNGGEESRNARTNDRPLFFPSLIIIIISVQTCTTFTCNMTVSALTDASQQRLEHTRAPIPVDRQWISKLLQKFPNPNSRRNDKALVVAPMVDQSELPFRLLCRRYGANLCYTPMIHARLAVTSKRYRDEFMGTWLQQDRPLIAQLCGSDPHHMLAAARMVEPYVDGIDINCGCPQQIARRGNYGAFLLEQEQVLLKLVRHMVAHLRVPLSIKVRLLPPPDISGPVPDDYDIPTESLKLYGKLVDAGIHLLTIHGRTRKQKAELTGHADWKTIAKAVELFGHRIPIFANGSIQDYDDVQECLRITKVDGVMSSESLLEYPPIFYRIPQTPTRTIGRVQLAQEYMELAEQYPSNKGGQGSHVKCVRKHLHTFLHKDFQEDTDLRDLVCDAKGFDDLKAVVEECRKRHLQNNHQVETEMLSWYRRYRDAPFKPKADPVSVLADQTVADGSEMGPEFFGSGECCGEDNGDY